MRRRLSELVRSCWTLKVWVCTALSVCVNECMRVRTHVIVCAYIYIYIYVCMGICVLSGQGVSILIQRPWVPSREEQWCWWEFHSDENATSRAKSRELITLKQLMSHIEEQVGSAWRASISYDMDIIVLLYQVLYIKFSLVDPPLLLLLSLAAQNKDNAILVFSVLLTLIT